MKSYFKKLIKSDSSESSKRFISLWVMTLASIVVIKMVIKSDGLLAVLGTLLGFITTLLGIATYQSVKNK